MKSVKAQNLVFGCQTSTQQNDMKSDKLRTKEFYISLLCSKFIYDTSLDKALIF